MKEIFIEVPHFPTGKITCALVSKSATKMHSFLEQNGIQCIPVTASSNISPSIADHPDMRACHLGGRSVLLESGALDLGTYLRNKGFHIQFSTQKLDRKYPEEVKLNAIYTKEVCIAHKQYTDSKIIAHALQNFSKLIWVRQGYIKCSVALVAPNVFITSDRGIAKCLSDAGAKCLLIIPGYIKLPGYSTGFIGGTCFLMDPHTLCFNGNFALHPDGENIKRWCAQYGVDVVPIGDGPLKDIGSVLPLKCMV